MTAREIARLMQRRADLVEPEFLATSRGLAKSAVKFTKELLTSQIYAIPEDVNPKTGKKRWRRTGQLRRSERAEVVDPYTVRVYNTAAYAQPRHEAGKPGARAINPARESHWRDELLEKFAPVVADLHRETVLAILRKA
jgi:hypothetical protein